MNEYIVWDKKNKEWVHDTEHPIHLFGEIIIFGNILRKPDDTFVKIEDLSYIEAFRYMGKKDINDNKIYADSSIVEFEYHDSHFGWQKWISIFSYDDEELCFNITIDGELKSYSSVSSDIANLKITGTLQENGDLLK